MNTHTRRAQHTTEHEGLDSRHIEVTSDGRTVWVNGPTLLARFCPISREYCTVPKGDDDLPQPDGMTPHPGGPTGVDWNAFVRGVQSRYGVSIGPEHRPDYIPADSDSG